MEDTVLEAQVFEGPRSRNTSSKNEARGYARRITIRLFRSETLLFGKSSLSYECALESRTSSHASPFTWKLVTKLRHSRN